MVVSLVTVRRLRRQKELFLAGVMKRLQFTAPWPALSLYLSLVMAGRPLCGVAGQ